MSTRKSVRSTKSVAAKPTTVEQETLVAPKRQKSVAPTAKDVKSTAQATKPRKLKLVRDSFTMPDFDYALIGALKQRALDHKVILKKSQALRAGLQVLSALTIEQLLGAITALEAVKTGRPKK